MAKRGASTPLAPLPWLRPWTTPVRNLYKFSVKKYIIPVTSRPIYTRRTLTRVKLNNSRTQYSRPAIVWQCNQDTEPELLQ